jgi:hypothetical protein
VARWKVDMTAQSKIELKNLLKRGFIVNADVKVLLKWVDEMEESFIKFKKIKLL